MIDIDKLDDLPFREAIHTRFKSDSDFNSCIRKRYRTERISYKEWKIARDTIKHNVGKSIDHAYSNFCHKSTGYCKDFFWRRFKVNSYGAEYRVVNGLIVYDDFSWKKYKKRPIKSEYLDPKLVQARAEKRQQEKRNLRFKRLAQKNGQFNFIHYNDKYKKQIQSLIKLYRKGNIESLSGYKAAIVEYWDKINDPTLRLEYFPDSSIKYSKFESDWRRLRLIKLLE